ncbi:MAG: hypothetical protein IAE77_13820 [Prosthecobacter sp.]|jgi:hypothetical protein|uniref:hypothetical protein n=1 Tax=Prosthecobacter sp. TaxID=1965333 RepID=UPI0019DA4FC5|nr:hypothetical protein [Prosthecobacter sp.]MBE2284529.1 hypothetical protein [Prosthecobacter sp.]
MCDLIYTIAIDRKGEFLQRNLAKLLVSSIVRSGFSGKILVIHNSNDKLFLFPREQVKEESIDFDEVGDLSVEAIWSLKHRLVNILLENSWQRLIFFDADCLVLKSLDPILNAQWEVLICREPGQSIVESQFNCFLSDSEMNTLKCDGINSGVFGVQRGVAEDFFRRWSASEKSVERRRRLCADQASLNRVILDTNYCLFDCGPLVSMPYHPGIKSSNLRQRCISHFVGAVGQEKLRAAFGLFMGTYFFDSRLTLFNLLES